METNKIFICFQKVFQTNHPQKLMWNTNKFILLLRMSSNENNKKNFA